MIFNIAILTSIITIAALTLPPSYHKTVNPIKESAITTPQSPLDTGSSTATVTTVPQNSESTITPTVAPSPMFSADSNLYPGTGHIDIGGFVATTTPWTVNYTYLCKDGNTVYVLLYTGSQPIPINSGVSFSSATGSFIIVVPDDSTCTWQLTVN